jgi:predicted secreted protein
LELSRVHVEAGGYCRAVILCRITLSAMSTGRDTEEIAAKAAEVVRQAIAEAESRATEIVKGAEAKAASVREQAEAEAAQIRERAEGDARAQIEAAKRALDELGGTLAAAASSALPKAESERQKTEIEQRAESPGAPEAPVSPPAEPEPEPEQTGSTAANGDDAAERLVAMKMAVDGKDQAAIEAELVEKFGPGDRTELLKDVLERVSR